jgi:hypothetical protein
MQQVVRELVKSDGVVAAVDFANMDTGASSLCFWAKEFLTLRPKTELIET